MYVLRDCHKAQSIWGLLLKAQDRLEFFHAGMSTWLINNLFNKEIIKKGCIWATVFDVTLCYLWKNIN